MNTLNTTNAKAGRPGIAAMTRNSTPVMYWAALGAMFLCLAFYVWGSWILSDDFRPVPVGNDPIPLNVKIAVRAIEALAAAVALGMLWKCVFGPWIRNRELSFDGMLVLNLLLMWWADPIDNYVTVSFLYNGYTINMGSWASFIPGWGSPNPQNFAEPLLMMGGFYIGYWMLNVFLGCWLLGLLQRRLPNLAMGWRILLMFIPLAIIDLVVENLIMRSGAAAYPGVVRSFSLYPGEVYQWPLYEAAIVAFVSTGFTCLRYFKDDKGQTFVEKGVERLKISKGRKKLVTFLAIAGFVQPFFLIGYFLPYNLFAMRSDTAPAYPSYMRNLMCGEGSQYACPSYDWVPIPQRGSRIFVTPDDPRLPQEVRDAQGIKASGKDPYATEQ